MYVFIVIFGDNRSVLSGYMMVWMTFLAGVDGFNAREVLTLNNPVHSG
jgi:hypothetical protein